MDPLVLFCKTYYNDMGRARRLIKSIFQYNVDKLPVYLSVPQKDLAQIKDFFQPLPCHFITDEEILSSTKSAYGELPKTFPPHLTQQLIKLEFWRMDNCLNYVWLDSDSYFIKPFNTYDFLHSSGDPYFVQHDCLDLLDFAKRRGRPKIVSDYHVLRKKFKQLFQRTGPNYDFGPCPVVWSVKVLEDMYTQYLVKKNETIFTLLMTYPSELLLYGEFVKQRQQIIVHPVKPFFKVYHYAEQFFEDEVNGVDHEELAEKYFGIVMQSNWAKLPEKKANVGKRIAKEIQRWKKHFT